MLALDSMLELLAAIFPVWGGVMQRFCFGSLTGSKRLIEPIRPRDTVAPTKARPVGGFCGLRCCMSSIAMALLLTLFAGAARTYAETPLSDVVAAFRQRQQSVRTMT